MKTRFLILTVLILLALAVSPRMARAQDPTPEDPAPIAAPGSLEDLTAQLASLGGISAMITVAVNALKRAGIVKDGQAQNWSAGFNLLALAALLALGVFRPGEDLQQIDQTAGAFAQIGLVVLAFIGQLAVSQATHARLRGIPIAGTTNTEQP